MFKSSTQQIVDAFAAQFESDGNHGYFYRHHGRGAGIPVSAPERKAFIKVYAIESRWLLPRTLAGTFVLIFVSLVVRPNVPAYILSVGIGGIVILTLSAITRRSYNAPRDALAGRVAEGPERTRREARALALARLSWSQLLFGIVIFASTFALESTKYDMLRGWGILWTSVCAVGIGLTCYRAAQKWRTRPADTPA